MSVTTTAGRQGRFETQFFHLAYEEEFGRVKGHFGPINTLCMSPTGRSFASGGEEGFMRINHLPENYFTAFEKKTAEAFGRPDIYQGSNEQELRDLADSRNRAHGEAT